MNLILKIASSILIDIIYSWLGNCEGGIYKASNFKHLGMTQPSKVIVWDKKLYHEKTIRNDRPYARKVKAAVDSGQAYYRDTLPKHIYMYELRS